VNVPLEAKKRVLKMRILHITPTYIPAYRYGGPIYCVHGLCRALAALGHDVHVLTTSVDGSKDSDVRYDRAENLDGVMLHYCSSQLFRRLYVSPHLYTRCRGMIGNFDVAHLHSVFLFPTLAGVRAAVRLGVPYVLSPHGMLVRDLIARRNRAIKWMWIHLIERQNLTRAARIHLTSEEERRALLDLGLMLAPTAVIPYGTDRPARFSPSEVSGDVRAVIAQGFDILSFGRISWKKGLDRLIRSLGEMQGATALIAGNDEDGLTVDLRKIADECGVADRVRFLSRQIEGADKEVLFASARLFALPSLSENFGNVVPEAMIRGLPVVVTADVGAAEIVKASGGGWVAASAAEFGTVLANALRSKEVLASIGAAGAAYARERLNWESIAVRFEELYREVSVRSGHSARQLALA
jgi:glycosyltransferase involved in cell wall biosynthesis